MKLDYEEITPCLKEVTRVWEEMLVTPERAKERFDFEKLTDAVKAGKVYFSVTSAPLVNNGGIVTEKLAIVMLQIVIIRYQRFLKVYCLTH